MALVQTGTMVKGLATSATGGENPTGPLSSENPTMQPSTAAGGVPPTLLAGAIETATAKQQEATVLAEQAKIYSTTAGTLTASLQRKPIPEGGARFATAHHELRYICERGRELVFRLGELVLNKEDAAEIKELRAAIRSGNMQIWEIKVDGAAVRHQN